jgi:hypothetical protein
VPLAYCSVEAPIARARVECISNSRGPNPRRTGVGDPHIAQGDAGARKVGGEGLIAELVQVEKEGALGMVHDATAEPARTR